MLVTQVRLLACAFPVGMLVRFFHLPRKSEKCTKCLFVSCLKRIARTAWRTLLRFPRQVCQVCAARGHLELARCAFTLPRKTAAKWGRRLASSLPLCLCARVSGYLSIQENRHDTVSEWLRRWTINPLGSARRGSNPLGVVCAPQIVEGEVWLSGKAAWPAEEHKREHRASPRPRGKF